MYKRFSTGTTVLYFLTLISTTIILWLIYNNTDKFSDDGTGILFVICGIIELVFSLYLLVKSADSEYNK